MFVATAMINELAENRISLGDFRARPFENSNFYQVPRLLFRMDSCSVHFFSRFLAAAWKSYGCDVVFKNILCDRDMFSSFSEEILDELYNWWLVKMRKKMNEKLWRKCFLSCEIFWNADPKQIRRVRCVHERLRGKG